MKQLVFCILLASGLLPLIAQQPRPSDASSRLESLAAARIAPSDLGDWAGILESAAFLLFRRTELDRGTLTILVSPGTEPDAELFQDGTLWISTALLDLIDLTLFTSDDLSTRRIRHLESEREYLVAPFIAYQAALKALGLSSRSAGSVSSGASAATGAQTAQADSFAAMLLSVAGYPARAQDQALAMLGPATQARRDTLRREAETNTALAQDLLTALLALRDGAALDNGQKIIRAMQELYPDAPYLDRLETFFAVRLYLASIPAASAFPPPFLPFNTGSFSPKTGPLWPATGIPARIPGNERLFTEALNGLTRLAAASTDDLVVSTRAAFLVLAGDPSFTGEAIQLSELASLREDQGTGFAANANRAWVLFMTKRDPLRARMILTNSLVLQQRPQAGIQGTLPSQERLSAGNPANAHDAARLLLWFGRQSGIDPEDLTDYPDLTAWDPDTLPPLTLRGIRTGITSDRLISAWGHPAEIIYDFSTEYWVYPSLAARITIRRETGSSTDRITAIHLGYGSPVSLPADIRTGDSRSSIEEHLGAPSYRAGDCEVYARGGSRIAILYLSNTAREITVAE